MNAVEQRSARAPGDRGPAAVACSRHVEPPRPRARRAGACQRPRTRPALRRWSARSCSETIHLNESLGAPSARADGEAVCRDRGRRRASAGRAGSFDLVGRISEFLSGFAPRTIAYAAAAATVAFFLQSAMLTAALMKDHSDTTTPQLASANTPSNAHAVIRFAPLATSSEITSFLNAHGAEVVEGPGRNGSFNIRFSAETSAGEVVRERAAHAI